jgi:hypothetical protein
MNGVKKTDGFEDEQFYIISGEFSAGYKKSPYAHLPSVWMMGYFPRAQYHYCDYSMPNDSLVMYCTNGSGYYALDGGAQHRLNAGQLVVFPPELRRLYAASDDDPWSIFFVNFNGDVFPYIYNVDFPDYPVQISDIYGERLQDLFRRCFYILRMPYLTEDYIYLCKMAETILSIIPCAAKRSQRGGGGGYNHQRCQGRGTGPCIYKEQPA